MIIDAHAYVGRPPVRVSMSEVDISPEWLIRLMDESGIDKMIVMPPANWAPGCDYRAGTDEVVAAVNKYPDRFIGFTGVTGYCVKHGIADLKYGIEEKGLRGAGEFKAAPGMYESIIIPIMSYLEKYRLPVLIHVYTPSEAKMAEYVARKLPNLPVIMGHMGGTDVTAGRMCIEAAKKRENLFLETSSSPFDIIFAAVKELGAERVVFGSDAPFVHPIPELKKIMELPISKEDKELILYKNILKLVEGTFKNDNSTIPL